MPIGSHSVVRIVEGLEGSVPMYTSLSPRFGFGAYKPWVMKPNGAIEMVVAPDALIIRTTAPLEHDEKDVRSVFTIKKGESVSFELTWHPSFVAAPPPLDIATALGGSEQESRAWLGRSKYNGAYADDVNASFVVLKAMTYLPSGGVIAAPTAG